MTLQGKGNHESEEHPTSCWNDLLGDIWDMWLWCWHTGDCSRFAELPSIGTIPSLGCWGGDEDTGVVLLRQYFECQRIGSQTDKKRLMWNPQMWLWLLGSNVWGQYLGLCVCLHMINLLLKLSWVRISIYLKHCQRHNGPEGWVHLAKVTSWGHITCSNTNHITFYLQNVD